MGAGCVCDLPAHGRLQYTKEKEIAVDAAPPRRYGRKFVQKESPMPTSTPDSELKDRHRKMWASGDYPGMVETFLLPLGPRLVEACGIGPGMRVLDVAARRSPRRPTRARTTARRS